MHPKILHLLTFLSAHVVVVKSFSQSPLFVSRYSCCSTIRPSSSSSPLLLQAVKGGRGGAISRRKTRNDEGKGFDQDQNYPTPSKSDNIYSMPPLYDLAFGYRSYEEEVDFLLGVHTKYAKTTSSSSDRQPLRLLELAAGPARHSLAALSEHPVSEVEFVLALDRSHAMVEYGLQNADQELGVPGGGRRDDFKYIIGDMRNTVDHATPSLFDSAWLLLGSMQHLLTNDDVIACFSSLHSVIQTGGTVVIELPHPRETFSMGECTKNGWTVPLIENELDLNKQEKKYGELNIVWGDEDDEFDPVRQIRHFTVGMELKLTDISGIPKDDDTVTTMFKDGTNLKDIVPMRLYTLQEIDALARCAGFELVGKYGALAEDVSIEDEIEAFRMVCVLRKR